VTVGSDERALSEGAEGGARAEGRLLAGSGFPREEELPDYNVAESSGEHIIMVLPGEEEVHYNVYAP